MKRPLQSLTLLILATTALALPARADDTPPVVDLLMKNWESQLHIAPSYEDLKDDGAGNITITNLKLDKPADDKGPEIKGTVAEIDLKGVADKGDGLWEIGTADFSGAKLNITDKDKAFAVDLPQAHAEGWYLKEAGDNPTPAELLRANMSVVRKAQTGKITVTAAGQTFTGDGYQSTWDGDPATGAGTFSFSSGNVNIPAAALALADQQGMLKQLGYGDLNLAFSGDGKLDIDGDKMGVTLNISPAVKDVGTLKFAFAASDLPVAAYAELLKAQKESREPDFKALMPDLMGTSISGFTMRFEDQSITNKVLPMIAAMQGMNKDALVANAGAMAQMGLMSLNNQEFTTKVVTAINTFLKDPKSLTVSLKPAQPLKVQEIMSLNPANAAEAITKLGVNVTAND